MGEVQRRAENLKNLPDDTIRKVHVHYLPDPEKTIVVFDTVAKQTPLPGFPLALLRLPDGATVVLNMASIAYVRFEALPDAPADSIVKLVE